MEVNNRPKIQHPKGTLSLNNHTFGSREASLLVSFKLSGIFSIFDSRQSTDNYFIGSTPIPITPKENDWDPNSSCCKRNEDLYINAN